MTYEGLLAEILTHGEERTDRTGTGAFSLFAPEPLVYDLRQMHVPLITSKTVPWRMALAEYMWMLSGSTNINELGSPSMQAIWRNWADENGDIGPTYGAQYRHAGGYDFTEGAESEGIDQLALVIERLVDTPDTRRALINLWSAPELEDMGLEPCMILFQFSLRGPNLDQLEVQVYQRSADMMLGVPFDLFQAGVLAHLVAREVGIETGRHITATKLTWAAGDVHVYFNQVEPAMWLLKQAIHAPRMRAKLEVPRTSDRLRLLDGTLTSGHLNVVDYFAMPAISAPLAV